MNLIPIFGLIALFFSANIWSGEIYGYEPEKFYEVKVRPTENANSLLEIDFDSMMNTDGTVIVFFDVDGILIRNKLTIFNFSNAQQYTYIDKFADDKKLTEAQYNSFDDFLAEQYKNRREILMDAKIPELLNELHRRGAIIMGLTARHFQQAEVTEEALSKVGIDFSAFSFSSTCFTRDGRSGLRNRIFYTGGILDKVSFIPWLVYGIKSELGLSGPFFAHHIDDNTQVIAHFENYYSFKKHPFKLRITPHYVKAQNEWLQSVTEAKINAELRKIYKKFLQKQLQDRRAKTAALKRSLTASSNRSVVTLPQ